MQAPGELPTLSFAVPAAAGLAGVVLSFVLSPFELVKVICLAGCSAHECDCKGGCQGYFGVSELHDMNWLYKAP